MQFHLTVKNEKRRGLLWPIARKRNLISLHSAAVFTIFVCNWSICLQISQLFKNRSINFLKNLTILRLSINVRLLQVSRTLRTRKVIKWGSKCHKFSLTSYVNKWASSLFTGIVFKFHMHVHNFNLYSKVSSITLQRNFRNRLM